LPKGSDPGHPGAFEDEIGELAESVNAMRKKMGEAVGQSMAISSVLSDSSSQQAASIEETSASLDEMASMTRRKCRQYHGGQTTSW